MLLCFFICWLWFLIGLWWLIMCFLFWSWVGKLVLLIFMCFVSILMRDIVDIVGWCVIFGWFGLLMIMFIFFLIIYCILVGGFIFLIFVRINWSCCMFYCCEFFIIVFLVVRLMKFKIYFFLDLRGLIMFGIDCWKFFGSSVVIVGGVGVLLVFN